MSSNSVFTDNLNHILDRKGWSRSDLHRASGVSNAFLSDVCNGIGNPSIEKIDEISKAFYIPPWVFLLPSSLFRYIVNGSHASKLSNEDALNLCLRYTEKQKHDGLTPTTPPTTATPD